VAVNLLNWNPVPRAGTHEAFQPSTPAAVSAFKDALIAAHIETVVRQSKGASIQGACGQLAGRRGGSGGLVPGRPQRLQPSDPRAARLLPPGAARW